MTDDTPGPYEPIAPGPRDDVPVRAWDVPEEPAPAPGEPQMPQRQMVALPAVLFALTCVTTYNLHGPWFSIPLMFTLVCHELGHYIQAVRYGVPASLPYFIPLPGQASLFGTMGAVIFMRGRMPNRRVLFDIGITGPLAGLPPALIFSIVGLHLSQVVPLDQLRNHGIVLGESVLFKLLSFWIVGPLPPHHDVVLHPLALAGWVGLFVTAFNLVPIGQLDGGHILYGLLRRRAHTVALLIYGWAILAMVITQTWIWTLMLILLGLMGLRHPPTLDDDAPLGRGRAILGWLTLLFFFLSFTPNPVQFLD